ncbi:MAG: hypothetical protein HYX91_00100 [Chloroflexi bacterium]|nr:hypothetical protein [Chloroflexota bacterium]
MLFISCSPVLETPEDLQATLARFFNVRPGPVQSLEMSLNPDDIAQQIVKDREIRRMAILNLRDYRRPSGKAVQLV